MSISVLCLLTGQTVKAAVQDPALRDIMPRLLEEAEAIGRSCYPDTTRNTRGGAPADHKPSLLQDYERGRAMEINALARAPAAFARMAGLSTPMLDLLTAMAIRQARDKGLYPAAHRVLSGAEHRHAGNTRNSRQLIIKIDISIVSKKYVVVSSVG